MKKPTRTTPRLTLVPLSSLAFVVGGDGDGSKPTTSGKHQAQVLAFIKG